MMMKRIENAFRWLMAKIYRLGYIEINRLAVSKNFDIAIYFISISNAMPHYLQ